VPDFTTVTSAPCYTQRRLAVNVYQFIGQSALIVILPEAVCHARTESGYMLSIIRSNHF